jgi:hypothetical protein
VSPAAIKTRIEAEISHLRCLTGDRYREVRMPLDRSELQVFPSGPVAPKTIDQLSRGTAE